MKQTPLKRGRPPARRTPLRTKPKPRLLRDEREAKAVFKNWWMGQVCASCKIRPARVTHHIVLAQYLQGMDLWRLENAMALCRYCHDAHHSPNGPRLRRVDVPDAALEFASRVLGGRAGSYFARKYA